MVTPITRVERRQVYTAATVALSLVVAFEVVALTTGYARWPSLVLPSSLLCLTAAELAGERRPRIARWLIWTAYPLVAAAVVYAGVLAVGTLRHVAG